LEIDMRWNSTLAMFERYLHLHLAISEMCSKDSLMLSSLENEDLLILKSLLILKIAQHINRTKNHSNVIQLMKKKFEKYWSVIIDHIIIAHVLDPRYKLEHLKETLIEVSRYSDTAAESFVENIRQKIILYGAKYQN
ncbi:11428_t:CDS:2, partial [Scutellospora calospora]